MEAILKIFDDIMEHIDETEVQQKAEPTKWFAIRTGAGKVKGYIEMFWADALRRYVTVPGASRSVDVSGLPERQH